jgi:2,4-dienoyl-CoA reductase (NADPH2)
MNDQPLFSTPLQIGNLTLRNRMVATAHGIAAVKNGMPLSEDAEYWERLSHGGAAMIIAGGVQVAKESIFRNRYLSEAYNRDALPGFRERAAAMKSGGAIPVVQLGHLGAETLGGNTVYPFVSPSPVKTPRDQAPARALHEDEISKIVEGFAESARNSVEAGFEMVEIHGAHGYLIAQFLSSMMNTRQDRYGGSPEARITFLVEIIERIRDLIPDTPLGLRVSVENDPGGLSLDDFKQLLPMIHDRAPIDYLNLTYGNRGYYVRDMATRFPILLHQNTEALRKLLGVPLLLCSGFRQPDEIEEALQSGAADLVGMARPFIADPDVARKFIEGRPEDVRPCVSCNQDCRSFDPTGLCTVNPDLAPQGEEIRPGEATILSGPQSGGRRVAVIGAGPAGLECALTLAKETQDAEVTVFDAASELGGALRTATSVETRQGWKALLRYYSYQLKKYNVHLQLGTQIDSEGQLEDFDHVVWAIGAEEEQVELESDIPVLRSTDFLNQESRELDGKRVAILDDGFGAWAAVSSVEDALYRGAQEVLLITPGTTFAATIPAESRLQLMERLKGKAVRILPLYTVEAVCNRQLELKHTLTGSALNEPADVLVTVGLRQQRELPVEPSPSSWGIGDVLSPRQVSHAITEGRHAGLDVLAALQG